MGSKDDHGDDNAMARTTHIGRRTVLGIGAIGAAGIAFGAAVDNAVGGALTKIGNDLGGLGALIPGANQFRFYTVTGTFPYVSPTAYRLRVDGMVDHRLDLSIDDLRSMKRTKLAHNFQCVTGWVVPNVHWEGVLLSDVLAKAGVKKEGTALRFFSGDGVYTESLTIEEAHLPNVLVADKMIGDDVSTDHGGPVRMYVAPMYGYKSIKWLDRIEVVDKVVPGYWENYGYPVDGWIGGSE